MFLRALDTKLLEVSCLKHVSTEGNALTNASFLFAAWAAWMLAKRTGTLSTTVRVLVALSIQPA